MNTVQIFIPTFNRRHMLESAIVSVLDQTYPLIEVIVLDNASIDSTQSFMIDLMRRDGRVHYHRNAENVGMVANFNQIGLMVTAPFFCVLTDDDVYEPHFLDTTIRLFHAYPSIAFAASTAPIRKGGVILRDMLERWSEGLHLKGSQVHACSHSHHPLFTHCLFRRELAREFFFHEEIWSVADGFLLTCLATKYDMAISKVVTGYWNLHGNNATETQDFDLEKYILALSDLSLYYAEFCNKNGLLNRLNGFYRKKLWIGLMRAGSQLNLYEEVIKKPQVRGRLSGVEVFAIRVLSRFHFLDFALSFKALMRRLGVMR